MSSPIVVKPRCPQCGGKVALEVSYGKFECRHCHVIFTVGERPTLDKDEKGEIE